MRLITEKSSSIWILSVLALAVAINIPGASAQGNPKTIRVDCDRGETVTRALGFVDPGDTIIIKGICNENLLFNSPTGHFNGLTLDGQGTATIAGPDSTLNVIELTGVSRFTIRGLTISRGFLGVTGNTGTPIRVQSAASENTTSHPSPFYTGT